MPKEGKTIYQTARLVANLTQEKAAELLNVSPKSVGAYERGETIPPDDIVVSMTKTYQTPWLAYMHLTINNEVGKEYLGITFIICCR